MIGRIGIVALTVALASGGLADEVVRWSYPPRAWPRWEILKARSYTYENGMYVGYPVVLADALKNATFRSRDGKTVAVSASSQGGVPCVRGEGYEVKTESGKWIPCDVFDGTEDVPPHLMPYPQVKGVPTFRDGLYSAEGETVAYVWCRCARRPVLHVGESREEALSDDLEGFEQNCRMEPAGKSGEWRSVAPLAFRHYRFETPVEETWFVRDEARPALVGSYRSDNERLNRIWAASAETVRLCTRRFFVDAVKRDRMPWPGDHAIGFLADAATYRNAEAARFSIDALGCAKFDGLADYSPWWVIENGLYRRLYDDPDFIRRRWSVIRRRTDALAEGLRADGIVVKAANRNFYIDWGDRGKPTAAYNVLMYAAFDTAAALAEELGMTQDAVRWNATARRIADALMRLAYDEKSGLFRSDVDDPVSKVYRHPNLLAVLFGLVRGEKAQWIGDELAKDALPAVGTAWMEGLQCIVLMMTGHKDAVMPRIDRIWGGMADRGFNTTFEHWWSEAKGADAYAFYDRPYGLALCHIASPAPAYLLPALCEKDFRNPFDARTRPEPRATARRSRRPSASLPCQCGDSTAVSGVSKAEISVDFTQPCGELKRLNGIINTVKLTQFGNARICEEYDALEVPYVRYHDAALTNPGAAVMDLSRIFPLFHADENDPRNYDFRPTDDLLALTRRFCTEIEFKIGESIEHYEHRYRVNPPSDRAKYARICLNVIRHYNEGWADGFRWNIRRWSVWEEPDNTKLFNGDYRKEFFPLYGEIVRAIKAKYPDYEVGGCATRGREMFRAEQFVSYCREHSLPLDFCSITDYRRSLEPMFAVGEELRRILDTNGYHRTTVDLSEWHYEPADWRPAPGKDREEVHREVTGVNGGAFTASMLLLGQDSVYDRMLYYVADSDGGFWGLRGGADNGEVNSHWYALKAFADLARLRHRVKTVVPKDRGLAAAATRAEDGRAALMVAAFRTAGGTPLCIAVKGAERPTEVLLEDGASHRLSACAGWTFANGTLTLPATGRSAVWLITFGGYRARKLASHAPDPTASVRRMDFIREDGKFNFAFVVDAKNRELTSAPLKKFCDACRFDSGEVPEVYGDNDNEKIAQMPWLVVFGDSDFARRRGVNAAELKEGEFVIRPIDRGLLVVGGDAAANQKALTEFSRLASRTHWKIPHSPAL